MNEQVEFVTMSDRGKYLYDLQGFLVVTDFLTPDEVNALNESVDANLDKDGEYGDPELRHQGTKLEGQYRHFETHGMLTWPQPWCQPFRDLIAHPKLIPYLNTMLGRGWKLDQHPAIFTAKAGCEGAAFHGTTNTIFNGARFYAYQNGRMRSGLITCQYQLADVSPGAGGLGLIPGSHKANFKCPLVHEPGLDIMTWDANWELVYQPVMKAGDMLIFNEATMHGTLPWRGKHPRRPLFMRYTPKYMQHGSSLYQTGMPDWVSELTEEQRAVLEPPYVRSRPLIEDEGVSIDRPRWEN